MIVMDKRQWYRFIEDAILIEETIVDHTRWSVVYRQIWEHQGKFWEVYDEQPATEYQSYEFEGRTLLEVRPVEKTVVVYEAVE